MARFRRLTDAEARTLTRAELLDRVESEQRYWERKCSLSAEDTAAEREFSRIMHTYLSPQAAIDAVRDALEGRGSDYWETRPGDGPAADPGGLVQDEGRTTVPAQLVEDAEFVRQHGAATTRSPSGRCGSASAGN